MPLTLQEAIERAELMASQNGELKQESYNLLLHQLDDVDSYPFTIALVERGLSVRTGSKEEKFREIVYGSENELGVELDKAEEKVAEAAKRFAQQYRQTPGGLYMPETYFNEGEEEPEEEETSLTDQDIEWIGSPEEIEAIQEKLETLGISVDQDGNATFYKSSFPGMYTEQTKDKPISLDSAWNRFNTYVQGIDKDQSKVNGLLETLSGLTAAVNSMETYMNSNDAVGVAAYLTDVQDVLQKAFSGVKIPDPKGGKDKEALDVAVEIIKNDSAVFDESTISNLFENLNSLPGAITKIQEFNKAPQRKIFDPNSKNPEVSQIGTYLFEIQSSLSRGDFEGARDMIRDAQGLLEQRTQNQQQSYGQQVEAIEVLDKLIDMRDYNPEAFAQVTQNLGGRSPAKTQKEAPKQTARRQVNAA